MKNYTKFFALITTTLLTVALAGPANATGPQTQEPTVETVSAPVLAPVKASPSASVSFEKPVIKSVAAPVTSTPVVVAEAPVKVAEQVIETPAAPVAQPRPADPPQSVRTTPAQVRPSAPASSGLGAALLASAYSQVGTTQDCTAMVEKALGSIGIVTGDLAPNQFFRFGTVVGDPQPGDILISSGHVGIYAGNGQMVSGGFNGNQTVVHPVSYVGGFTAVRVA